MSIAILKGQINSLKIMPCNHPSEAKALCLATRKIIISNLGITGRMIPKCEMCNSVETHSDYSGPPIVESPSCQGSCIFRSDFPACFYKAEPEYLEYLESKGIQIEKAMMLLGIKSLFDLSAMESF